MVIKDIWFDLSFGYGTMPKAIAQEIVDKHTPDRLIFVLIQYIQHILFHCFR